MKRYIITETGPSTSVDPLDADQTQNLPVARMLYSTPLEISAQNELVSSVLTSFKVIDDGMGIELVVRKDKKYSDGKTMSPDDVVFAITRMAWKRPKFPVLSSILGLSTWLSEKEPLKSLPQGIQVKGDTIKIVFANRVHKPLFRFCLELFSIIPKKCVDLTSGRISCEQVPSSGLYKVSAKFESGIVFELINSADKKTRPGIIKFEYWNVSDVDSKLSSITTDDVVSGNESMYSAHQIKTLSSENLAYLPAARFADIDLNPAVPFFKEKKCRQVFADQFRTQFNQISNKHGSVEASIFTRIVPGYMDRKQLAAKEFANINSDDIKRCKVRFSEMPFNWGYVESEKNSGFVEALTATLNFFEATVPQPVVVNTRKELYKMFNDGKIGIVNGGSGFWAHDPIGDLQMLFTPNLHKSLDFITQDKKLQSLIQDASTNPGDIKKVKAVNQYLHDEALFNVYSFVRRFFLTKKSTSVSAIPFAVTSPSPWQVFE